MPEGRRNVRIVAASLLVAILSGLAALWGLLVSLPPTDGAYGQGVMGTLLDPFVLMVWLPLVCVGWIVGSVLGLLLLRPTNLARSLPLVGALAVATSAVMAASVSPSIALPAGLWAGAVAAGWARFMAALDPRWARPAREPPPGA